MMKSVTKSMIASSGNTVIKHLLTTAVSGHRCVWQMSMTELNMQLGLACRSITVKVWVNIIHVNFNFPAY